MSLDRPAPAPAAPAARRAPATRRRLAVSITGPVSVVYALDARSR